MPITSDPFQGGAPGLKNAPPGRRRSLLWPILFTTAVGALVSAALFLLARHLEQAWLREEVTQRAAGVATALQRQLEEPLSLLRSIASVYSSSRRASREGFHALALEALPRLPGVVAVEWIPRVPDALRAAHEEAARSQGLPWYQIQDRDARGHWGRAPQRPGYFPICFVEPAGAASELGRDLATSKEELAAMGWARDLPEAFASRPFPLLEGTNLAYRCRLFLAVFTNVVPPATVAERRRDLAGYAAVVVDAGRLMSATWGRLQPGTGRDLAWQLVDEPGGGAARLILQQSVNWTAGASRTGALAAAASVRCRAGGRAWVLRCVPTGSGSRAGRGGLRWGMLGGGLGATGFLVWCLLSALRPAAEMERLMRERTAARERTNQELREEIRRREQTEAALQAERDLIGALLDTIEDHIYFKDRQSRFIRVNRSMARIFKLNSPQDAVGKTDFDFFTSEHARRAFADEQEILRTGQPLIGREEQETWPDGSRTWVSSTKQCLRDKSGEIVGTFGISRDITARKLAEQELAGKALELERSNRELEQFAYVASHDLQEPLRMISSYTQLLARRYQGQLDADAQEFIGFAVEGAVRLQALIQDLLAYSRVGMSPRPFAPTDCAEVLARAIKNLQVAIDESKARITNSELPIVHGDGTLLTQLFQNLLSNAIKFRGDQPPVVEIAAERSREAGEPAWRFTVRDRGIGIEPQYFEKIFALFQRLHTREEYPGTGIGLAVCKKIVERHGGRIGVASEPGKGTMFHFTLRGPSVRGEDNIVAGAGAGRLSN